MPQVAAKLPDHVYMKHNLRKKSQTSRDDFGNWKSNRSRPAIPR